MKSLRILKFYDFRTYKADGVIIVNENEDILISGVDSIEDFFRLKEMFTSEGGSLHFSLGRGFVLVEKREDKNGISSITENSIHDIIVFYLR